MSSRSLPVKCFYCFSDKRPIASVAGMAFDATNHFGEPDFTKMVHRVIPVFRPARMIGGVDDLDFLQCSAPAFLAERHYVYSDFKQYRLHLIVFPDAGGSSAA